MADARQYLSGLHNDYDVMAYRNVTAWSPSLVVEGLASMQQLHWRRYHAKPETDAMKFGAAVHCSILEPDAFVRRYVLWDGGRRAGKTWEAWKAVNAGKQDLSEAQYAACLAARNAVRAHPKAAEYFKAGRAEVSAFWTDSETSLPCKGRIDWLCEGTDSFYAILDVKTTGRLDDRAIKTTCAAFAYHVRMAAYQAAVAQITGCILPVVLVFVQQAAPHEVLVRRMPSAILARGYDEWQRLLAEIASCEKAGRWPGRDEGESDLEMWASDLGAGEELTLDGEAI